MRQILTAYAIREVVEAPDGAKGYEQFKRKKADVIIVDWMMDKLNGIDFTRMVRTADDSPDKFVPIIMLTGYTEKERVLEARDAGVTEFMAKPVSSQSLYDRIVWVIENPRPFVSIGPYFGPDRRRKIGDFTGNDRRIVDGDEVGASEADEQRDTQEERATEEASDTQDTSGAALSGVRDQVGSLLQENS